MEYRLNRYYKSKFYLGRAYRATSTKWEDSRVMRVVVSLYLDFPKEYFPSTQLVLDAKFLTLIGCDPIDCIQSISNSYYGNWDTLNDHSELKGAVHHLLVCGIDANIGLEGMYSDTLLQLKYNSPEWVRMLLDAGADVFLKDSDWKSPLTRAVFDQNIEIIKMMAASL